MAQALLVTTARQEVSRLTQALDEKNLDVRIVLIAKFAEYSESRMVLASPVFDQLRGLSQYTEYLSVVRELELDDEFPSPLILSMDDSLVLELQQKPGPLENARGLNIGFVSLGRYFLEDGYVFRVRS